METTPQSAINIQRTNATNWTNAAGQLVPITHITAAERKKERLAAGLYKKALAVQAALLDAHTAMAAGTDEAAELSRCEYELKQGKKPKATKGNFTWYNFDNSIKVECKINEVLRWDEALMAEAHDLLNAYLSSQLTDNQTLIKELVNDAFSNTKGGIDSRKVFQLLKHESKIPSSRFKKACQLIRQANSVDRTKAYMTISERLQDGSYQAINLNFSSI